MPITSPTPPRGNRSATGTPTSAKITQDAAMANFFWISTSNSAARASDARACCAAAAVAPWTMIGPGGGRSGGGRWAAAGRGPAPAPGAGRGGEEAAPRGPRHGVGVEPRTLGGVEGQAREPAQVGEGRRPPGGACAVRGAPLRRYLLFLLAHRHLPVAPVGVVVRALESLAHLADLAPVPPQKH